MLIPTRPWFAARVTRAWLESDTLRGLAFVQPDVAARHRAPGQYLRVRIGDEENPYALASEPGAAELELLFKVETVLTAAMSCLVAGDEMLVGAPTGDGFPLGSHEGRDFILVAAGTGIAPLRAVVHGILAARARYGKVTLFYGHRTMAHFAYVEEWDGWRAAGIEVVPVVSGDLGRRVQDTVSAHRPACDNAVAYLAGMKGMIADVRQVLAELGLGEERVFLNY